ncbi:NUDIX hydrolase [Roseomonas sp. 18066]|uniref:NUDIX hydrolase n=1 Tax=Roseomonas sp. 18066 TaxID=2681412 RepID=UPI00135BA2AE|nr:NUDIX hydrolase [Roseomonas sp. 18066]
MAKSDRSGSIQYGVLPYRPGRAGHPEVLLLTSRGTGRWVIPKGWPILGKKPRAVAELEAREEAGIKGIISPMPVGSYAYTKVLDDGAMRVCECIVFLMLVTQEASKWPERFQRKRAWFAPDEAANLVDEKMLALLIRSLPKVNQGRS